MVFTLLYILIAVGGLGLVSSLIWVKINFNWLQNIAGLMIFSLPFERIPSLETAFGPIRVGHVLALIFWYVFALLWFKRDNRLLKVKLNPEPFFIIGFIVTSLLSIFDITNQARFLTSILAVFISFTLVFAISHFASDVWIWFKRVAYLYIGLIGFSIYQLIGDLAGLPGTLTGVKQIFQSHVFGFPRVHTTFNEPSYFANALFLGIFMYLAFLISNTEVFRDKLGVMHYNKRIKYLFTILGLVSAFILTLAKSSWILAPFFVVFIIYLTLNGSLFPFKKSSLILGAICLALLLVGANIAFPAQISKSLGFFTETTDGTSATAFERTRNLNSSLDLINENPIIGSGPGQFGTKAQQYIEFNNVSEYNLEAKETEKLIVFNMYTEVWAEYGLLPLLCILGLFGYSIIKNFVLYQRLGDRRNPYQLMRVVLGFYLIVSMIQWNFISPLYINPIFICLGMMIYLNNKTKLTPYED
jgi:hypothetical protein